jgi:hypothetical protein
MYADTIMNNPATVKGLEREGEGVHTQLHTPALTCGSSCKPLVALLHQSEAQQVDQVEL